MKEKKNKHQNTEWCWSVPVLRQRFWCEQAGTGASPCSSAVGPVCRRWSGPPCLRLHSWRGRRYTPRWQAGKTQRGTLHLLASLLCLSPLCWWEKADDDLENAVREYNTDESEVTTQSKSCHNFCAQLVLQKTTHRGNIFSTIRQTEKEEQWQWVTANANWNVCLETILWWNIFFACQSS